MLTAITGINWGDEGKGRMVDLLSEDYDIVIRYQGGNNAGHTVINEKGKFILNLLPSGILRDSTVNVMGPGMVIDVEHLFGEVQKLRDAGINITPDNLKISDRAVICMPYHKMLGRSRRGPSRRCEIRIDKTRHFPGICRPLYEKGVPYGRAASHGFGKKEDARNP